MSLFPAIDHVMGLTTIGMKQGRDHVRAIMRHLGNPEKQLKVLHVTGSNGKGSVCQMLSQVLWKNCGKKVGLFISPHLIDISERFQINGVPITHDALESLYHETLKLSHDLELPLSFFEIQVVTMILYFVREKVDYAVIEVGLGGLYDGTNIFDHPLACLITSITLEHTHILGKTRRSILKNKLGIVKPGTTLYTHINNQQVRDYCRNHNVILGMDDEEGIMKHSRKDIESSYYRNINNKKWEFTNLPGKHQQRNAELVLAALTDLGFGEEQIRAGLQHIDHPGRFQWIGTNILVDTANNRENITILARLVKSHSKVQSPKSKVVTIFGTTQTDPVYAADLANILPGKKILAEGFCDRALPCSLYQDRVSSLDQIWDLSTLSEREVSESIRNLSEDPDDLVLITGSLYLVGEFMKKSIHDISPTLKGK